MRIFLLLFLSAFAESLYSQNCLDNQECTAPQVLNIVTGIQTCVTDCNTGASVGPDFNGNNCHDFLFPTVWYQFTTNINDAAGEITLTSSALSSPYFTIFTTADCNQFSIINCTQGSNGSATNTVNLASNTTYLIAISDQNGATGNFNLCITTRQDNSACNTNNSLTVTNTSLGSPLTGPFQPGEQVTFCYNITDWQQVNCNYLQGIVPTFGDCWDPISFNAQGRPLNITQPLQTAGTIAASGITNFLCVGNPAGTWNWFPSGAVTYNNISGSQPPNSALPAGWFFLTSYNSATGACTPAPTDPDNSYGDASFPACAVNTLDWTICFTLQARAVIACTNGQTDCSVSVKTYADGEIGTWNSVGCTADLPTTLPATLACCVAPDVNVPQNQTACAGQTVSATTFSSPTAGTTYTWTNSNSAIGLAASGSGDIASFVATNNTNAPIIATITVTPFNVCQGNPQTYTITVNPLPNANAGTPQTITCVAPTVTLNGSSTTLGTTFSWSGTGIVSGGNTATSTVNAAGTYNLTVTISATGCTATTSVSVTANTTLPTPTIAPATVALCNGQSATLTASGGSSYLWSEGSPTAAITVNPVVNTTYTVTATNAANGCTASATRNVTVGNVPAATITPITASICVGNSVQLTASGGAAYAWSNGLTTASVSVSPAVNTTYTVTVTDASGCSATATRDVTVNALPTVTVNPTAAQTCFGQPVGLTATGGISYLWSNSATTDTISANPVNTTTFSVTATDVNGCTGTASSTVTIINNLSLTEQHTDVSCFGGNDGTINISTVGGNGPFTFLWNDNNTSEDRSSLIIGNYSVTATGSDGCAATISAELFQPTEIFVLATTVNESCSGNQDGSITLISNGGTPQYSYVWFDGDNANPKIGLSQGNYNVTVIDANNCESVNSFTVGIENPIVLNSTVNNPSCPPAADGAIILDVSGGNGGFVFAWSNSSATQDNTQLLPGSYDVTITDSRGCSISDSYTLAYQYQFDITISPSDTTVIKGLTAQINVVANVNNSVSFVWTPATGLSCSNCGNPIARPMETTNYLVTATDENGCTDNDSVLITVEDIGNIFVPNSFSPNADGANDIYAIYGARPEYLREFYFTIYDRWGEKVFETNDPTFTWDGAFKGKILKPTVLVYYMKYVLLGSDSVDVRKGTITLIQ